MPTKSKARSTIRNTRCLSIGNRGQSRQSPGGRRKTRGRPLGRPRSPLGAAFHPPLAPRPANQRVPGVDRSVSTGGTQRHVDSHQLRFGNYNSVALAFAVLGGVLGGYGKGLDVVQGDVGHFIGGAHLGVLNGGDVFRGEGHIFFRCPHMQQTRCSPGHRPSVLH